LSEKKNQIHASTAHTPPSVGSVCSTLTTAGYMLSKPWEDGLLMAGFWSGATSFSLCCLERFLLLFCPRIRYQLFAMCFSVSLALGLFSSCPDRDHFLPKRSQDGSSHYRASETK
jgi:hypothetical protein